MAAIKISSLPPLLNFSLNTGDYVVAITPIPGSSKYRAVRADSQQIISLVRAGITNQSLSSTDDVIFNSITSTTSVSSLNISAAHFFGDGSQLTNVFDQVLDTTSDVIFNSVSATEIFATNINIGGNSVIAKFSQTINHTGSPSPVLHTINHPFVTEDVTVQLFERKLQPGGLVQLELVIASIAHITNGTTSLVAITIVNKNDATYKIVITG